MVTAKKTSGKMSVAEYLEVQFNMIDKSQKQIAAEVGFPDANILTMLKKGRVRLPIARIPALAKSIGVDARFLIKLALTEYNPELWEAIKDIIGDEPLTANEKEIIEVIRHSDVPNPRIASDNDKAALLAVVESFGKNG